MKQSTVSEKQFEQAREIVKILENNYSTNGYLGVEIDSPFDNMGRFTEDYTIIDCLFGNIIDEIFVLTENLKYDETSEGLTRIEAKSHIKTLKRFIKKHTKDYFEGEKVYEYLKQSEDASR